MAPQFQYGLVRSGAGTPDPGWRTARACESGGCIEVAGWRKAGPSMHNGQCVEVGESPLVVGVRDSTLKGHGPVLEFSRQAWAAFAERVSAA